MSTISGFGNSSYLQQLSATSSLATNAAASAQPTQGAGPPPPPPGANPIGGAIREALASQGLDDEALEQIKSEVEAAIAQASETGELSLEGLQETITGILEANGVDTEQLASDLTELKERAQGFFANLGQGYQLQGQPSDDFTQLLLESLFSFDAQA